MSHDALLEMSFLFFVFHRLASWIGKMVRRYNALCMMVGVQHRWRTKAMSAGTVDYVSYRELIHVSHIAL
jgi:hypothetical protein